MWFNRVLLLLSVSIVIGPILAAAQTPQKFSQVDKFRQLEEILPTPNDFRTASGAPGAQYWQQQVNYEIDVRLNDDDQTISGFEKITYRNNSPDTLSYLWLQLDANIHRPDSDANLAATMPDLEGMSFGQLRSLLARQSFDGGFNITRVADHVAQKPLQHTIVKTMMRVDLPRPLPSGEEFVFEVEWNYAINNSRLIRGRSGYEHFDEDGNNIYEIAQWFPRLCAYSDATGWQHKQFLGRGEFTLEFGDYVVRITVPDDHVVAATGVLMNENDVLNETQRQRLEEARKSDRPVFIVTPEEAKANESTPPSGTRTWVFKADRVRDFAWASSRKFIWDAQLHRMGDFPVMAMSFYPNEGEPLWSRYSTRAIIHTLNVYSRYTFQYPYPVAISVNGPVGGMEYPMICFNGPRPEPDGTYSARTKYGLISVIIHEVGHNFFPMIVNSDERQWTWMDEGLNTFLQYLSEQEWEEGYPSRRGEPQDIVDYMRSFDQVPIMTNSESILQFGPNAYHKPATALNILRETILGRELFDYAFREYARRWKFKRPMPADFFRTMEDASGIDLDWFWRGWFYTTEHVDLAIVGVTEFRVSSGDPEEVKGRQREERENQPLTLSRERNRPLQKFIDLYPDLKDFYNAYDVLDVTDEEREAYQRKIEALSEEDRALLADGHVFYLVELENVGGLVMPVILEAEFDDGTKQTFRFPAELWNKNNVRVKKLLIVDRPIRSLTLDPRLETADCDLSNNRYPPEIPKSRFELFERRQRGDNPMQRAAKADQPDEQKQPEENK